MEFGEKLLLLLQEKELTQKEFAALLNIAPTTLNGYIKNKRQPDINLIKRIAFLLNVSTDYLLDFHGSSPELSIQELSAISKLRSLDDNQQRIIFDLISVTASRAKNNEKSTK